MYTNRLFETVKCVLFIEVTTCTWTCILFLAHCIKVECERWVHVATLCVWVWLHSVSGRGYTLCLGMATLCVWAWLHSVSGRGYTLCLQVMLQM